MAHSLLRTSLAALAVATLPLASTAFAADAIIDPTPAPAPAPVEVSPELSFYIAGRLGAAFAQDSDFDLNAAAAVPTGIDNEYDDTSLWGSVAVGGYLFPNVRGEVEVGFDRFDVDSHTVTALGATFGGASAFGETNVTTVLANAYYDIDLGSAFVPYVTGGLGYGHVEFDNHGIVTPAGGVAGLPGGNVTAMDDSDSGFAWQIGTGVGYEVTESVTLEVGYRYSAVEGIDLTAVDGTESGVDIDSHKVFAGVRFGF